MAKKTAKKTAKKVGLAVKITDDRAGSALADILAKKNPDGSEKLRRNGPIRKRVGKRLLSHYVAAGGDPRDWEAFFKWLLDFVSNLLPLILPLFV